MPRSSLLATLLLALQAGLLGYGALIHSPTFDETAHLPAGLAYWKLGREDVYPHNPPLVRSLAALPVLAVGAVLDEKPLKSASVLRPEFALGRKFIDDNGERAFWLYTVARWACLPLALLGGYVVFHWSRELYGPWAGLLSLWLWCFCPNVLGSGQWIAPDMGAAALGVSAGYLFWRWLGAPTWRSALAAGAVLGLAELAKFTWVVLFFLWPLIWLGVRDPVRARLGQLAVSLALGLYVLNLGYLFRGTLRPLESQSYFSQTLGGPLANQQNPANRFRGHWLGRVPVPLPRAYLAGVDLQKLDFEQGFRSYLRGEWKQGGWWYYYVYGLSIKVPLGTLALLAWAALAGRRGGGWAADGQLAGASGTHQRAAVGLESRRDLLCLLAPPLTILALVSSQTGFSHHLRYVLPVFPFALVFVGRLLPPDASRRQRMLVALAALATAVGSLSVYPHSASFFNRLVGGPLHGADHLVDSNISWGQDLLLLKSWLERRPGPPPSLHLAYFGNLDPRAAGIEFITPPLGPTEAAAAAAAWGQGVRADADLGPWPGLHVVDVSLLHGMDQFMPDGQGGLVRPKSELTDLSYFLEFEPSARIGYSLYVYELSLEQVNAVRLDRGLQPWGALPKP